MVKNKIGSVGILVDTCHMFELCKSRKKMKTIPGTFSIDERISLKEVVEYLAECMSQF